MSEKVRHTMVAAYEEVLKDNDLPNAYAITRSWFIFGEMGANPHFVSGYVRSVGYAPKEGVLLYVSPRRYRGINIKRLERRSKKWVAVSPTGETRPGHLVFL